MALLGDASHPTLPYQGQGAAMAVEDGAILGALLIKWQELSTSSGLAQAEKNKQLASLLEFYQELRQERTKTNVAGAVGTRHYYHLVDGKEQEERDQFLSALRQTDWQGPCPFNWADAEYQRSLLGFNVCADAEARFENWAATISMPSDSGIKE